MKKTSPKITFMLKRGFGALFALVLSIALGINAVKLPAGSGNAEVMRLDSLNIAGEQSICVSCMFIGFAVSMVVGTLLYLRWVFNKKAKEIN